MAVADGVAAAWTVVAGDGHAIRTVSATVAAALIAAAATRDRFAA